MNRSIAAAAGALALACGSAAGADPVRVDASLTINALDGAHEINGGESARLTFVPLPLVELVARRRRDALRIEGLPPVAFSYPGGDIIGTQTTRLSIVNATYRRSLGGGWFAGAGQTLYNQHTTYAQQPTAFYVRTEPPQAGIYRISGQEEQFSRVTGLRFEAGRSWSSGAGRIEASAAFNPHMHGVQYTYVPTGFRYSPTFADPEHAAQVDLAVRWVRPAGPHGAFLAGLRYINYSATYDDARGQLADRNVGLAPLLGYRIRL